MDLRNAVILTGRLGGDAEVKTVKTLDKATNERIDITLVEFSLATNRANQTDWHQVVSFGDENVKRLGQLRKGDKVQVNGYIRYDRVEVDGVRKTYPKIVATGYEMMTTRPPSNGKPSPTHSPTRERALQ